MSDHPSRSRAEREAAWERFKAADLPTSSLEEWRYSRIDDLDLDRYKFSFPATLPPAESDLALPGEVTRWLGLLGQPAALVRVRNGVVVGAEISDESVRVPESGRGDRLSGHAASDRAPGPFASVGEIAGEPDPFVSLNRAMAISPLELSVRRGARVRGPVVVAHWADVQGAALFPRTVLRLEEGAEATVLEVMASSDADALVLPVSEMDVGDSARLRHMSLQVLGKRAWQIWLQASRVGRDASLTSVAVSIGGDYTRMRTDSSLVAPGGTSELRSVYFGTGTQMQDFRTVQHHRAPKTTSDLLYKGAVANTARSVYSGLIRVEKGARGTNAYQTNRNLVLHEGAHADSVPNLEIEENDVRCSHASAVGPISEDERFYLESRGVPREVADQLISLGFLDEVLAQAPLQALLPELRLGLAAKLVEAEAGEADRALSTRAGR